MAVTRGGLQDRERDMRVDTRAPEPQGETDTAPEPEAAPRRSPAAIFRARLAAARELRPAGAERHWMIAWQQGRDAAVAAMTGGTWATAAEKARAIVAPAESPCRDCWAKGRDAVIAFVVPEKG